MTLDVLYWLLLVARSFGLHYIVDTFRNIAMKYLLICCIAICAVFGIGCNDDDNDTDVQPPAEGASHWHVTINSVEYDAVELDCIQSYTNTSNQLIWTDSSFILKQGNKLDLADNLDLVCAVYIYDESNRYDLYTPEILADYINNYTSNVVLEVSVQEGATLFKSQWFEDWKLPEFLDRQEVDQNALVVIKTDEPLRPDCTDNWPLLPIAIEYTGWLKTQDGMDSIRIDSLSARWYLVETL